MLEAGIETLLRKHYALPAEHGAWIWFLGPYVLGAAAGGRITIDLLWLLGAGLAAFLTRQPATIAIKALSGRRDRRQLKPALFWLTAYGLLALFMLAPLLNAGLWRLPLLALPGIPVFAWHLWLVRRRAERDRPGVEIVAAGVLALMAPAAYWVAGGPSTRTAVVIWLISWLQSAASIVHIHLRLNQRRMEQSPASLIQKVALGWRSLAYHGFNLMAGVALTAWFGLPAFVPITFTLMLLDAAHGTLVPAVGYPPSRIGLRQLLFSGLFFGLNAWGFWLAAVR